MTTTETALACALCDNLYHTNYTRMGAAPGLCPQCWNRDRGRELDRLISAKRKLAEGIPDDLTLYQWLTIISAFEGKCAMCGRVFELLEVWIPDHGVTANNVIPICRSCSFHRLYGFDQAVERIAAFLQNGDI